MVYLSILDTRKYFGSQKILTEITAILSWILLWWEKCGNFVVKIALWEMFCPKIFNIEGLNNIFCHFSMKIKIFYNITVTLPHKILHFYAYLMLFLRSWVPRCRRKFFMQIPGYQKTENYFQVCMEPCSKIFVERIFLLIYKTYHKYYIICQFFII